MKNKRGGILKKTIILLLLFLLAFMLFGCGQQEQTEATVLDVSTTEKQNIENSESASTATTDNGGKSTKVNDSETTYNTPSAENTTDADRENQTTTEIKTTLSVETTSNSITSEKKNEDIYTVIFKDYNGNTLKEEKVKKAKMLQHLNRPKGMVTYLLNGIHISKKLKRILQ